MKHKRLLGLALSGLMLFSVPLYIPAGKIMSNLEIRASAADFVMRTTAPSTSDSRYYSSNPFYKSGYGLPNCTCYAYGRAWEILGTQPKLPTGNAGAWWWKNKSSGTYSYGNTPKLGAIACWDKYDQNKGHVAVVEKIDGNNVVLSESHYGTNHNGTLFDNKTMKADGSNYLTSYRFLGYIYIGDFSPEPIMPESHNPNICIDGVEGGQGRARIHGWVYDPDDTASSTDIHVYAGEHFLGVIKANKEDDDGLKGVIGESSGYHRFDDNIWIPFRGDVSLSIAGINIGEGEHTWVNAHATVTDATNMGDEFNAYIVHKGSGKRIVANSADKVVLGSSQRADNNETAELWHFVRDGEKYQISNCRNGKILDIYGGTDNDGDIVNIIQGSEQKWYILENNGGYAIKPDCSRNKLMDVTGNSSEDGTQVAQFNSNWGDAQTFEIQIYAEAPHNPHICIDGVEGGQSRVRIHGWVYDPDDATASTDIHVYAGEHFLGVIKANKEDDDGLKAVIGEISGYHRFDETLFVPFRGDISLSIAGINIREGDHTWVNAHATVTDAANIGDEFNAYIVHKGSGKRIVANSADKVVLGSSQRADNNEAAELWHFVRDGEKYQISNCHNKKILDIYGGTDNEGDIVNIIQGSEQKWFILENNGGYAIKPDCSRNKLMDVTGNSSEDGTQVAQFNSNWGDAQTFEIQVLNDETAPIISEAEIIDVTSAGYTIKCKVVDNNAVTFVNVATWSDTLGQETDCQWNDLIKDGTYYTYTVKFDEHQNQLGSYSNHIYAYDAVGNKTLLAISFIPEKVVGDITLNGSVEVTDIIHFQKYLHGKQKLTQEQAQLADMNDDGIVNVYDLILLKRKIIYG